MPHMTPEDFKQVALSNADIKRTIDENARYRRELHRCIEVLSAKTQARNEHEFLSAVFKAHDAIVDGIKIFISYQFGTRLAPAVLLTPFKNFGQGRIKMTDGWPFVAETSVKSGSKWSSDIFRSIAQTHWFFQLLPQESTDRYWVSFEAGHYHGVMQRDVDRLVCIHNPSVPLAGPLQVFKGIKGDAPTILRFLQELLCEMDAMPGMDGISPGLSINDLLPHAQAITDGMRQLGSVTRQFLINYVDIALDAEHAPSSVDELCECVVMSSLGADLLFDYIASDATGSKFKDLVSRLDTYGDANSVWLEQFLQAIQAIYARAKPATIYAEFRSADGLYYRPQMHAVRRREADGTIESAHLVFYEALATPVVSAPVELDTLETAFQLAYRLRWVLLEEYSRIRTKRDLEKLKHALLRMEIESEQRGLYRRSIVSPDDIIDNPLVTAFEPEQRDEISRLYAAYQQIRRPGSEDGLLDKAFQTGSVQLAQEALQKLRRINCTFAKLAADRLAELVKRNW
jgi:hypothetical protein